MTESELKRKLISDVDLLEDFASRLLRDLESGGVISAIVVTGLSEAVCQIAYNAGRYNQEVMSPDRAVTAERKG